MFKWSCRITVKLMAAVCRNIKIVNTCDRFCLGATFIFFYFFFFYFMFLSSIFNYTWQHTFRCSINNLEVELSVHLYCFLVLFFTVNIS